MLFNDSSVVIRTQKLGKKYQIDKMAKARDKSLREDLLGLSPFHRSHKMIHEQFWALQDIDLEIYKGEALGIVGANGSGKSTLLKLLSRVTWPSTGEIELYGRVGALLEVGIGFHTELSGRENIYLCGAILGMKRKEVARYFDEIVAFSGVEEFLDMPVKKYSSGMFLRLAFSVMAHLKSEVLIVDEVIAVGDRAFQEKCLRKMEMILQEGRTIIFVSHQIEKIKELCSRVIWLEKGRLIADGPMEAVVEKFTSSASLVTT